MNTDLANGASTRSSPSNNTASAGGGAGKKNNYKPTRSKSNTWGNRNSDNTPPRHMQAQHRHQAPRVQGHSGGHHPQEQQGQPQQHQGQQQPRPFFPQHIPPNQPASAPLPQRPMDPRPALEIYRPPGLRGISEAVAMDQGLQFHFPPPRTDDMIARHVVVTQYGGALPDDHLRRHSTSFHDIRTPVMFSGGRKVMGRANTVSIAPQFHAYQSQIPSGSLINLGGIYNPALQAQYRHPHPGSILIQSLQHSKSSSALNHPVNPAQRSVRFEEPENSPSDASSSSSRDKNKKGSHHSGHQSSRVHRAGNGAGKPHREAESHHHHGPKVRRSKSFGSTSEMAQVLERITQEVSEEMRRNMSNRGDPNVTEYGDDPLEALALLGPFHDANDSKFLRNAVLNASNLSLRDAIRTIELIFRCVQESSKYADPASRLCFFFMEKEEESTFIELFLNTCQEHFNDRFILYSSGEDPLDDCSPPLRNPHKWVAFVHFVNASYAQMKRREYSLVDRKDLDRCPIEQLLALLTEIAFDLIRDEALGNVQEAECFYHVTVGGLGRELERHYPNRVKALMHRVKDAILSCHATSHVRKTLMEVMELQAAKWLLPASAVKYYYPRY